MRRAMIGIGAAFGVVLLLAGAAFIWLHLYGWNGLLSQRNLRPGDSITMESGLTFTLPAAWRGSYVTYLWLPEWLAPREGLLNPSVSIGGPRHTEFADGLDVQQAGSSGDRLIAFSLNRGSGLPGRGSYWTELARNSTMTVFQDGPGGELVAVTAVPGHLPSWMRVRSAEGTSTAPLKRVWAALAVRGAQLP